MSIGNVEVAFDKIVGLVAHALKSSGFERRGRILKAISKGNAAIVEFQKSDKSTKQELLFTINIGVVCGDLLDADRTDVNQVTIMHAHLRNRLGMLLENPHDTWWEVNATSDVNRLASELVTLISAKAVPYLERFRDTDALVALWESNTSPGLTAVQRSRYLSELKEKRNHQRPP
jgi:hypothetical protein